MSAYDELIDFVTDSGIPRSEAEHAVKRSALAMARYSIGTYAAGGAVTYLLSMNPTTALPYLVTAAAGGAAYGLAKAPQCEEVRTAIRYWSTAKF